VEGHKRHHVPPGRAWHRFVARDDPLNSLGEARQLAHLNETKELLMGDGGARLARYRTGEVSGELGTQPAAAMWRRKNLKLKGQARGRKEANRKQSPEPVLDARF
jgi:hypothetical protein